MNPNILKKLGFQEKQDYFFKTILLNNRKVVLRAYLDNSGIRWEVIPETTKLTGIAEIKLIEAHKDGIINLEEISQDELKKGIKVHDEIVKIENNASLTAFEQEKRTDEKRPKEDHLANIRKIIKNDIFEIFSDSGLGKSLIAFEIAINSKKNGYKVLYIDTEHNIDDEIAKLLGDSYHYIPKENEVWKFLDRILENEEKLDLIVIDSIGFPIYTEWVSRNLAEKGQALLKMAHYMAKLKPYCKKNNALCIITNQPVSEMAVAMHKERKPFGGKAYHIAKEIVRPVKDEKKSDLGQTIIYLKTFRSRKYPKDLTLATVKITSDGVFIDWKIEDAEKYRLRFSKYD